MESRQSSEELHLELEDLAALADGSHDLKQLREARDHLALCRTCMSAYADAVRYRAAWLSKQSPFTAGTARIAQVGVKQPRAPSSAILAAAAVAVGVLIIVSTLVLRPSPPEPMPAAIRAMLERASSAGLVIPGGEAGAAATQQAYRSGAPADVAGERATEDVRLLYERGRRSSDALYVLAAGLIASERLDLARDYVAEGRRRFPGDYRTLVLAGILAYRLRDLAGAERSLQAARERAPHDPLVLLDLGLVGLESGGGDRARSLLRTVIDEHPGSPLAQRAERALRRNSEQPPIGSR